jgi:hypothetical protein
LEVPSVELVAPRFDFTRAAQDYRETLKRLRL